MCNKNKDQIMHRYDNLQASLYPRANASSCLATTAPDMVLDKMAVQLSNFFRVQHLLLASASRVSWKVHFQIESRFPSAAGLPDAKFSNQKYRLG
jgi:hypothetical protein